MPEGHLIVEEPAGENVPLAVRVGMEPFAALQAITMGVLIDGVVLKN